jgi:mannose-6-phosphate isomerase-like protein (cupin superfamily)
VLIRRSEVQPFDFDGLRIHDYTAGLTVSSSVAVVHVEPGGGHREAWSRRSEKYYFVLSGEIQATVDGEAHELRFGDVLLVRQGQRFAYRNTTTDCASLLLVHSPSFDPEAEVFAEDDAALPS